MSRGIELRRAGRLREALEHFRRLSHSYPHDADVWFYLAVTLDNLGRERDAIPGYHRVLRLAPEHPKRYEVLLYLSSSCRKVGLPRAPTGTSSPPSPSGALRPFRRG
jgi:Flp pilus assembly protein TadD